MKLRIGSLMVGALAVALLVPATAGAEVHSRSQEIVVVKPHDLPEMAQLPGESLLLHSDNQGSTYLYVEQEQGTRLSVFDVTDPARIRMSSTIKLQTPGVFDFAGEVTGRTELLRFRDGSHTAILDLRRANRPAFKR